MKVTNRMWAPILAVILAVGWIAAVYGQDKAAKGGAAGKYPIAVMDTSMGTIKIELYTDKAPVTAKNFIAYVNAGFYNNTIFHRVVPGFVIQGGGYLESMVAKPTRAGIQNESKNGLKNLRGTLSMARYNDPNSATSQFFINLANNPHLDPPAGGWGYAVFAKVIEGMDVVDRITKVKTATRSVQGTPFESVPVEPIIIKSAKLLP